MSLARNTAVLDGCVEVEVDTPAPVVVVVVVVEMDPLRDDDFVDKGEEEDPVVLDFRLP
jgi:hypothetical protein